MAEPTDDQLRDIARRASGTGVHSGGVKALRAVWEASRAAALAEYEPEKDERLVRFMSMATPLGYSSALTVVQEMTKLLAAEDIARRNPLVEGTEWEYGIRPEDDDVPLGISPMPTFEAAQTRANNIYGGWVIVRRRKAGPWEPVEQEGNEDR